MIGPGARRPEADLMVQIDDNDRKDRSDRRMGIELQIMLGLVLIVAFCALAWFMAPQA
jgi:hypothetical protein